MTKRMLIDATHAEETRVAVVDGNRLNDFDYESKMRRQLKGSIYLAKVTRVEPSLQAAFVNFGGNRHGFLPFSEIHPDYFRIPVSDREALIAEQREEMDARRRAEEEEDLAEEGVGTPARESDDDEGEDDALEEVGGENRVVAEEEDTGEDNLDVSGDDDDEEDPLLPVPEVAEEAEAEDNSAEEEFEDAEEEIDDQPDASFDDEGDDEDDESEDDVSAEGSFDEDDSDEGDSEDDAEDGDAVGNQLPSDEEDPEDNIGNLKSGEDTNVIAGEGAREGRGRNGGRGGRDRFRGRNGGGRNGQGGRGGRGGGRNGQGGRRMAASSRRVEMVGGDTEGEHPVRPSLRRNYKIQEVVKRGQIMLIQVSKEERGNKGAAVTTYLSLPGRYCVLMPNSPRGGGVSRKIASFEERKRMRELLSDLEIPDGMSVIMRTAGVQRNKVEIKRDLDYLLKLWDGIRELTLQSEAPAQIHEEGTLIRRAIRDLYAREIEEIVVAGDEGFKMAKDFMRILMPSHIKRVKQYKDTIPLFHRYQVESQIAAMGEPTVTLKSGGYLVINPTEALVSVDVNSGKSTKERHIEETALKTNLEAAEEVARQLRLRDLGGLVVIDFIDMEDRRNNAKVERRLKDALSNDRARIQVGRISMFGLMELSRQRLNPSLTEAQFQKCAHCEGIGYVRTVDSAAITALRALEEEGIRGRSVEVILQLPNEVAIYILNHKRDMLDDIERRYGFRILIRTDESLAPDNHKIDLVRGTPVMAAPVAGVSADGIATDTSTEDDDIVQEEFEDEGSSEGDDGKREAREGDGEGNGERRRRGRRGGRNRRGRGRDRDDQPREGGEDRAPREGDLSPPREGGAEGSEGGFGEGFDDNTSSESGESGDSAEGEGRREGGRGRREGGRSGRGGRYGRGRDRNRGDRAPREGDENRSPREGEGEGEQREAGDRPSREGADNQVLEGGDEGRQPREGRGGRRPRRPREDNASSSSSEGIANDRYESQSSPASPAASAERSEIKVVRHGARSSTAEAPATPPAPKDYEVVNAEPTEKKKGWWNRLVE